MSQTDQRPTLVSILIPVHNERPYVRRCVEQLLRAPLPSGIEREFVIVDDGSDDGTWAALEALNTATGATVRLLRHERRLGRGAALRTAAQAMRGDFAVIHDADLEYDAADIATLLRPLLDGSADAVYGTRFAARAMRRVVSYGHATRQRLLTQFSNWMTGLDLTDVMTAAKAFRADLLKTIPLRSQGFSFDVELTAKLAKRACVVYEVPINYHGRDKREGGKRSWMDGWRVVASVLKYWVIDDCFDENYGQAILQSLSHARQFNRWMVRVIEPYLGNRILEVGAGIGNVSRQLPKREKLILTDIDARYLELLHEAFDGNDLVRIAKLNLNEPCDFEQLGEGICDTIVCLNVLEHIDDHLGALRRILRLLTPGGRVVLLVPQYPWLYGSYDEHVEHYRRYTRRSLADVLAQAGFERPRFKNFNCLSIPGWWLNSCVLRRKEMDRWQLKLYDMTVPVMRIVERVLPLPGLSLIAVAQRPSTPTPTPEARV